jgi:hypothetical protein
MTQARNECHGLPLRQRDTRKPRKWPFSSSASSARVLWSRPWLSETNPSERDYVVRVAASPCDKTQILMTTHRLTDTEFHATPSRSKFVGYGIVSMAARDQNTDQFVRNA